jgi:hypothetical protein
MRRDDDGPYVRYLDHIEALARVEASSVHQRAVLNTIPLDRTAELLRSENASLRAQIAALRARLGEPAAAAKRSDGSRGG